MAVFVSEFLGQYGFMTCTTWVYSIFPYNDTRDMHSYLEISGSKILYHKRDFI